MRHAYRSVLAVIGAGTALLLLSASVIGAAVRRPVRTPSARIILTSAGPHIPRSFLGISIEYNELTHFEDSGALFHRALSLIRARDGSPVLLRLGGRSANDAYWNAPTRGAPRWVFELDDNWVNGLASLARKDDLRVMLDLNLPVHSPTMEAAFASAVAQALSPSRLAGLAIGNEPDFYFHEFALDRERVSTTLPSAAPHWSLGYSPSNYWHDFRLYARVLRKAVPGVPLAGPEVPSYSHGWLPSTSSLHLGGPDEVAIHRYALSTCWGPRYSPTVRSLLSARAVGGLSRLAGDAIGYARTNRLPIRLTEVNSISLCGGTAIANSFATALWAPDALFQMLSAGVRGVNLHIRSRLLNAPFLLGAGGLEAEPELYGLALFAQMIGRHARLLGLQLVAQQAPHLSAWAVSSTTGTRVLLINKGRRSVDAEIQAQGTGGTAEAERLEAPSPLSNSGVTLAGRTVGPDGRWHGIPVLSTIPQYAGVYRVAVPAYSAAIVRLPKP